MASSIPELEASIREAISPGFRLKLLARGQSRSMIWRDGVLPPDAHPFSPLLSYDLMSYGYSLLSHGLRLLEGEGSAELARSAFEHAGDALEAVVSKGDNTPERDFHRLVAAAAYHLGRFSARAYSLLHESIQEANLTECELCIARLMLRDLDKLDSEVARWRLGGTASDEELISVVSSSDSAMVDGVTDDTPDSGLIDALDRSLTDNFLGSVAMAMLAFERGESVLLEDAIERLRVGMEGAAEFNFVSLWWSHKLTIHLLRGLWDMSFHNRLPISGAPDGNLSIWFDLRSLFISSLYRRKKSEIELWPSQLEAANRVLEFDANLVLSLPTSAGKTRIAELCILACLSTGKRVVFVTPLRALSAQTEIGLQRTFLPLGKTVSSLYGSMGVSGADVDALKIRDIIVATPEKLDFALRNDPTLLDDVGLVVLDEGHMIGLNEREVRYEAQIQRLLRRSDATTRRIICLSAILPAGEQLDDFVAWLTQDKPEGLIQQKWRPTRLRFGEVEWKGDHARLTVSVGDEKPFVPNFFSARVPPSGQRTKKFPADQRELCLATAWRLVEDGQTVLIFCPLKSSVEPFASAIVDLNKRGVLKSVLEADEKLLAPALSIGEEWFGTKHALLKCLRLGIAIHHGALPSPYRKEIERLLQTGILKITVSSPTLAQGLNLSATSLVFHGLTRHGKTIEISEFRNVVGRAGRAYIDVEGLVLLPIFEDFAKNRNKWKTLIDDQSGRQMESGLVRLIFALLIRMTQKLGTKDVGKLAEYVAGTGAWDFPIVNGESAKNAAEERSKWQNYITSLDTAILSLLGDQTIADDDIEKCLETALESSLFQRRLKYRNESTKVLFSTTLSDRAKFMWANSTPTQRRGYFLAGVGLETGRILDELATQLEVLLIDANATLLLKQDASAIQAVTAFAKIIFSIPPFVPKTLPDTWKDVLSIWLSGNPMASLSSETSKEVLQFVEDGLIYKLAWGMEAVRVRRLAHFNPFADGATLDAYEHGLAVAAVETGTTNRSAAYLMQAGFGSRVAAIKAVHDGGGTFTKASELARWLRSAPVVTLTAEVTWPSSETHSLWVEFVRTFDAPLERIWKRTEGTIQVSWMKGKLPLPGLPLRIGSTVGAEDIVFSADYEQLGILQTSANPHRKGLLTATVSEEPNTIAWQYVGPDG